MQSCDFRIIASAKSLTPIEYGRITEIFLKSRREGFKQDDQLLRSRADELADVRRQIEVIDNEWARTRWRDEIDVNTSPMVTGVEWSALLVRGNTDWGKWGVLESNAQWSEMAKANLLFENR